MSAGRSTSDESAGERSEQTGAASAGRTPAQEAQELAEQGVARFSSGQEAEAQRLFSRALQMDSNNFTALYMLGNIYATLLLRDDEGLELLKRAVTICPDRADAHYSVGVLAGKKGDLSGAISSLQRALELKPDLVPALQSLAAFAVKSSRIEDAIHAWRRLDELGAADGSNYRNLAAALEQLDWTDEAIETYRKAIALLPRDTDLCLHLAWLLKTKGRQEEALSILQRATETAPEDGAVLETLAQAYYDAGRVEEAASTAERSVAANPKSKTALERLVQLSVVAGRTEFAEAELRRRSAAGSGTEDRSAWHLVHLLEFCGRYEEALATIEDFLERDPRNIEQRFLLWNLHLALGEYERGFRDYNWFMGQGRYHGRFFNLPSWNGKPVPGKTILLFAEHDMAAAIQFARYIPLVKQTSLARIVVECQEELMPVMRLIDGVTYVVARPKPNQPDPQADAQIGLMSLPRFYPTTVSSIPGPMPYIAAPSYTVRKASELVRDAAGLKAGFCWTADSDMENAALRSCKLADLKPLLTTPGTAPCSLQTVDAAELADVELSMIDMSARIADAADFLGVIAVMDVVITIDCAIAHLAGAMGKPVWLLLPIMPPWAWSIGRTDSPWYASARLFRQRVAGDWTAPIAEAAEALRALAADRLA
jgi:tetratricopeptide (TPR) repeat protein